MVGMGKVQACAHALYVIMHVCLREKKMANAAT